MANKKIYIAGQMTGLKDFNFPAFDKAKERLLSSLPNCIVISPADIDRAFGFDGVGYSGDPSELNWSNQKLGSVIARDIEALSECDAIYMIKGWENSKGANIEYQFAKMIGIDIICE